MKSWFRFLPALVAAGFPALAFAHPGHSHAHAPGFGAGLVHPLTGADHLVAAVVLAALLVVAGRRALKRPGVVAVAVAALAGGHAGIHAALPPVGVGFAAGVAAGTALIYAAAAGAGMALAARRMRRARARRD